MTDISHPFSISNLEIPSEIWATIISYLTPDEIIAFRHISQVMYQIVMNGGMTKTAMMESLWQPTLNRLHNLEKSISTRAKGDVLQAVKTSFTYINALQQKEFDHLNKYYYLHTIAVHFKKYATTFAELEARNQALDSKNTAIIEQYINKKDTALDLENAQITRFPEKILAKQHLKAYWQQLKVLDLSKNRLRDLPQAICQLENLESLDFSDNQLQIFPQTITTLKKLQTLNLSQNNIQRLPHAICDMTQLQRLGIQYNQLFSLPQAIGKLSNLKLLYLDNNKLWCLPDTIGTLTKLEKLWLSENNIHVLPDSITNLCLLQELNLDDNQLQYLPQLIGNLDQLTLLCLDNNALATLPNTIANLRQLEECDLSNNYLQDYQLPANLALFDLGPQRPQPVSITPLLSRIQSLKLTATHHTISENKNRKQEGEHKVRPYEEK